ncbi:hypothetical protein [Flavobacterium sp. Root420]|uniref:hypothetical protein n=1 Tax=Flavobacterium sp. Root420 TaxID=1736533 RepID=UPI000AA52457|nr:hypothetical protein [Flavobacterium sp. Root420]
MNIIQLFSLLNIKGDQILEFGAEDYIRIENEKMHSSIKIIIVVVFLLIVFHKLGYY